MKDDSTKDNLEIVIKEVLANHEVVFNQQDWNEIEKLLDAQPKERSFKWNFVFVTIVGFAALAATYFISHYASSDKIIKNKEEVIPPVGDKVISATTADSTVSAKKDTTALQASPSVNNSNKNSTPQEIVPSKSPIVIDERDKQNEKKEKEIQKNTEISEIRNRKSKDKGDSLKTRNLLQKSRSVIPNADSANEHSIDIIEEKGIISTNEIKDNAESVSDGIEKTDIENKREEKKILASDSTSQKSIPNLKRKLKFKKHK